MGIHQHELDDHSDSRYLWEQEHVQFVRLNSVFTRTKYFSSRLAMKIVNIIGFWFVRNKTNLLAYWPTRLWQLLQFDCSFFPLFWGFSQKRSLNKHLALPTYCRFWANLVNMWMKPTFWTSPMVFGYDFHKCSWVSIYSGESKAQ